MQRSEFITKILEVRRRNQRVFRHLRERRSRKRKAALANVQSLSENSYESLVENILEFLRDVGGEEGDDEEIQNILQLLAAVQAVHTEGELDLPFTIPTGLRNAEGLWERLERVAKFLSRLRNRRHLSEDG